MEREPRRRRRPALSCLECRRRKIKCDRNDPCAHCVSAKTQCTYKVYSNEPAIRQQPQQGSSRGESTSTPSAYASSPVAQARQQISTNRPVIEYGNHPSGTRVAAAAAAAAAAGGGGGGQNDTPNTLGRNDNDNNNNIRPTNRVQGAGPDLRDLLQRVQKLEQSSASSPIQGLSETGTGGNILALQSGLQDAQITLNKTRILRWSHWMGAAQEVCTVQPSLHYLIYTSVITFH